MILLQQMFVLFLLMMVGVACRKTGLMDDRISKGMSGMVVNFASPAFLITAGMNSDDVVPNKLLIQCIIACVLVYAAIILIAIALPHILRIKKSSFGTYRVLTIFSNIGFMGFPIISATYGSVGLIYAAFFNFAFNLLIYTYGIQVMQSSSDNGGETYRFSLKKLVNPGVAAVFIALFLYISRVNVPVPIADAVTHIGRLTVPMSMMVIGYSLSGMRLNTLITDYKLLLFALIKQFIIPIIGIPILKLFIQDPTLLGVCFIMISTPSATMCAMIAQLYGGDDETASKAIALTTLISVLSIPILGGIFGV